MTLKTRMACLACDPTQVAIIKNNMKLKSEGLKAVVPGCANFLRWLPVVRDVVNKIGDYVVAATGDAKVKTLLTDARAVPKDFDIEKCKFKFSSKAWTTD